MIEWAALIAAVGFAVLAAHAAFYIAVHTHSKIDEDRRKSEKHTAEMNKAYGWRRD